MPYNYYPLIRGRQFDLLALQHILLSTKHIIPIIEPVKAIPTLKKTLRLLLPKKQVGWIENPLVGQYGLQPSAQQQLPTTKLRQQPNLKSVYYFDQRNCDSTNVNTNQTYVICQNYTYLNAHQQQLSQWSPQAVIIPDEARFRQLLQHTQLPQISLSDPFHYEADLGEYLDQPDEHFTWAPYLGRLRPYQIGFSDYAISGAYYSDVGAPKTRQAIHLTYRGPAGDIRMHHFVSFDDGQLFGQKEKFLDLLTQLRHFVAAHRSEIQLTAPLQQLLYHFEITKNPGFGTVKRLLLAHHLRVIDQTLDQIN
ncbi:sce7725 family protein [Agrilactobacillus fermenti]|uniref:sce7725 family protein n=1 Tax=Agrilactobacillus fermenti TaxID=2586909 RepID=UPI003A5BDDA3